MTTVFDLEFIQNGFLPELKPYERKKGRPSKINYIYRERSLYYGRIQDIIKLCELREYDLKGHRELILFLYRYYLCSFTEDIEKALNDVLELNSMFRQALSEREVIRATRSAERCYLDKNKQYKYKNETLIDFLELDYELCERLGLESIYKIKTQEEWNKDYYNRNSDDRKKKYKEQLKSEGKLSEKDKISQRRVKIKDLLGQGLKQKDICSQLDISKPTYVRDRNFLKEQGLI